MLRMNLRLEDIIRFFCHNVLIMKQEFAERFGINAIIWGYSGAIIDLTSGGHFVEKVK